MSAIGLLAGTLGDKDVGVFNASYRLAWMNLTVIGSFSSAACTQLGIGLGTGDGARCTKIVGFGISTVACFLVATTALTVIFVEPLAGIFSTDPEVIALFKDCGHAMGFMIFFMCFSMHFELVLFAIGKSKVVARSAILGSWVGQVPAVLLMIKLLGPQLQAVYLGVGIGYAFYFILVFVPFASVDWHEQARLKKEENMKTQPLVSK
jgi:Na+-driven multidrug efflux pump